MRYIMALRSEIHENLSIIVIDNNLLTTDTDNWIEGAALEYGTQEEIPGFRNGLR
jgi:hypothetical protein